MATVGTSNGLGCSAFDPNTDPDPDLIWSSDADPHIFFQILLARRVHMNIIASWPRLAGCLSIPPPAASSTAFRAVCAAPFFCGWNVYSGQSYEHRRVWIRDRLRELSGLFAIEVHADAVMSNQLHVVVRTLAGRAGAWDDAEVARRWLGHFPGTGGKPDQPPEGSVIRDLCRVRLGG